MCPCVFPRCAIIAISRDRPMKPCGTRGRVDRVYLNPVKCTCMIDDRIEHPLCVHVACKRRILRNIVPHGLKRKISQVYKLGRNNALALPPQYTHQGPLTRGPSKCQPLYSPCGTPSGVCVNSRGPCHASASARAT